MEILSVSMTNIVEQSCRPGGIYSWSHTVAIDWSNAFGCWKPRLVETTAASGKLAIRGRVVVEPLLT
jgi:hypothetical protein